MTLRLALLVALVLSACGSPTSSPPMSDAHTRLLGWRQHDLTRSQPDRVDPAPEPLSTPAPSDAIVLIGPDGSGLDAWETQAEGGGPAPWRAENGALVVVPGSGGIQTRERFGDVQLHIEWIPAAEPAKNGQDRSNSGLFFADGRYEVQILDSWENPTYADGRAAAIYGQFPPLADAMRPPDQWQSYDVAFRMPRFGPDSTVTEPARLTVLHNGVLVHNNEVLPGMTTWLESFPYEAHGEGRISLQDHGSPVRFRNLWVRRLPERAVAPEGYPGFTEVELTDDQLEAFVGPYAREGGTIWRIVRTADGLGLDVGRDAPLRMVAVSPTAFELVNTAGRVEFDAASPTQLTFTMGGGVYPATRTTEGSDAP